MQSIIFFGSDRYAKTTLESLLESKKFTSIKVITDRPKPVGKDRILTLSEVEKSAITHNLKYSYYPDFDHSLITEDTLGLCASFDHLIPQNIIGLFDGHLYNLHPSLLPQYRNVSPVQYALALGDDSTGITLFRISEGIDNGEIIGQAEEPILEEDTTPTLTPRLFKLGAQLFIDAAKNNFLPTGKLENRYTGKLVFTHRLTRDSGYIEWEVLHKLLQNNSVPPSDTANKLLQLRLSQSTLPEGIKILHDLLRALTPWPTVWSKIPSKKGELRITLESVKPTIMLKIAGKPNSITWTDFQTYYL